MHNRSNIANASDCVKNIEAWISTHATQVDVSVARAVHEIICKVREEIVTKTLGSDATVAGKRAR